MGLEAGVLSAITAATSVASVGVGIAQNQRARKAQKEAANVQAAQNKQQEMEERRRQIREERIRRARIEQASTNTGVSASSGEMGAVGALSTTLNANIGSNLGAVALGQQLSGAMQTSANAQSAARTASFLGDIAPTVIGLGDSIFRDNDPLGDFIKQRNLQNK